MTIEVAPAGQIMPALGVFDACSQGTVESFMGASYYWDKKEPATQWFCTVPFGMNPQGMQAWYFEGDGLKLWEETYAAFGLVPRPAAPVAPQMAGWFRKKINTVADFKGLKMRIPGLGGQVVSKLGGSVVLMPGGEIFAAPRARRDRRVRMDRAARRSQARPPEHGALLLLSRLARAGHDARVRHSTRRPTTRFRPISSASSTTPRSRPGRTRSPSGK